MPLDLVAELTTIASTLDDDGLPYALAGGLALAVHGAARATTDIDLLVRPADLEAVLDALRRLGFRFRAGNPMTFPDGMRIQRVSKIDDAEVLTVDLLLVDPPLEDAWASRGRYRGLGTELSVISREALIEMKTWAGRPRDLADIQALQEQDR